MKYCFGYLTKSGINGIEVETGKRIDLKKGDFKSFEAFLLKLKEDDEVYLPFGSADAFALACARAGAKVFRISSAKLKELGEGKPEESILKNLEKREIFYPLLEVDEKILELKLLLNASYLMQEQRIAFGHRIRGLVENEVFRRLSKPERNSWIKEKVEELVEEYKNFVKGVVEFTPEQIEKIERTCLEKARKLYEEEFEIGPDLFMERRVNSLLEQFPFEDFEKALFKEMGSLLKEIPIFQHLREQIKGAGEKILAQVISEIQTIRRFPELKNLSGYAGFKVDGGRALKRKKGERFGISSKLKQALYAFAQFGVERAGSHNPVWYELYKVYKEYQRKRHPQPVKIGQIWYYTGKHIQQMAYRFIAHQFLTLIYYEWKRFEGLPVEGRYRPPEEMIRVYEEKIRNLGEGNRIAAEANEVIPSILDLRVDEL